jgi:general secretion pathway protein L
LSILYIRHPSKASVESAASGSPLPCPFAFVSDSGAIERQGVAAISTMSRMINDAQRVVLMLAASDVSLLRVKVPPLSLAKLKLALPNLVEDQLIADPAECVVVAAKSESVDGMSSVAVVQRIWLALLVHNLQAQGARKIVALPAQLCLPHQADTVSVAVGEQEGEHDIGIDLTLRLSPLEGIGLPVLSDSAATVAQDVLMALRAIVPETALNLYVPQAHMPQYQAVAMHGVHVDADSWQHWITGARAASLDLMAGYSAGGASEVDWKRWRWPIVLAVLVALVHIVSLNYQWLHAKRESAALRATMLQTYKNAYPRETVIQDPLAQMKQKIEAAKIASGQAGPGDFTALVAGFTKEWHNVTHSGKPAPAIIGIDYKDKALQVRLKNDTQAPLAEMKDALASRNLVLADPSVAGVWQIRSTK